METSPPTNKRHKGRPRGSANKATLQGREAIAAFVETNAGALNELLEDIRKTNPLAAFQCIVSLIEFYIPKLARQEHTGKDGERLNISVNTGVIVNPMQIEHKQNTIDASYVVDLPDLIKTVIEHEPTKE